MKKISLLLILLAGVLSAPAAITVTNTLAPLALTGTPVLFGTNYSTPVVVGYVSFPFNPNMVINQGGLNTTQSATFYTIVSTGSNTNLGGATVATNTFSTTAAGSITVLPGNVTVPIYAWTETVVTNTTTIWHSVITGTP